ncbi:DNA-binding transcriptional MocR family regulator [Pseudomonas silensiensis]|nr:DNA-binding transcriptional MocR family regulator [Pseudomonas silensiensis]
MNTQDSQYGSSYAAWIVHFREHIAMQVSKSNKLANVCYDIRGPVLKHAKRLEEEGHRILKLNIGNPAPFGFEAPDEILQDVIRNLPTAQGYSDSKGLFSARKAVMQYYQQKQVEGVGIEDIYLGNGVSELIVMSLQALLNNGDEVLVPAPDYPLWTAAVSLSGGNPVHYLCDEQANWWPDLADIKAKITPNTKALVIINPNNPTGAVYSKEVLLGMLELARQHNLVVFSDEIYDKIHVRRCRAHLHRLPGAGPAVPDLQRSVQVLSCGRFPFRLDRHFRSEAPRPELHRRHRHAGQHAPVCQRAESACNPDRSRRLPEHQ